MSELETKGATSHVGEAFEDFMRAFEAFKETNDERLYALERRGASDPLIEEKLTRIDRALDDNRRVVDELALKSARPPMGGSAPRSGAALQHKAAFESYVRKGEPGRLRDLEAKALSVGSDPDGGYLVPDETETAVNRALKDISPIRAIAGIRQVSGSVYKRPFATSGPATGWVAETAARPETSTLKHIPDEAVRAIYAARYWTPAGCAGFVPALAFFHFDAAVNHGVVGAIRLLQRAVGTDVDGEIGPLTLAAVARRPLGETLDAYADVRRARYHALPHFWRFGRGWLKRVDTTLARARAIAATSVPSSQMQTKGPDDMAASSTPTTKWWGNSVTIWGALLTGLSTVLPALGPAIGIDITSDLVREVGEKIVETTQAVGGLIGLAMTIYGRVRATQPLERRDMTVKL